jgi:hypothetical protein
VLRLGYTLTALPAAWSAPNGSLARYLLVVDAPSGAGDLDSIGVAAPAGAVTLAILLTSSERAGRSYNAPATSRSRSAWP